MLTIDEATCSAPPDVCFQVAADVEEWPRILPHYRWVRFRRKQDFARGLVEMAAWRPFGPVRYPTWWLSEMECDRARRSVRYRHVDGITTGMDVVWEVKPDGGEDDVHGDDGNTGDGHAGAANPGHGGGRTRLRIVHEWDGPAWPLIRGIAANLVIGPHFISHIAGRTLAGVAQEAERQAMGDAS